MTTDKTIDYGQYLVMVIEDDPHYRTLLQKLVIERVGARCIAVGNTIEGFQHFSQRRPDLIILDLFLPDMNGLVAVERLKSLESTKRIPILVCSANAEPETITCLGSYGIRDYLVKPINLLSAIQKIKSLLPDPGEYDMMEDF